MSEDIKVDTKKLDSISVDDAAIRNKNLVKIRHNNIINKIVPRLNNKHINKSRLKFRQYAYYNLYRASSVYKKHLSNRKYIWGIDPSLNGTGLAIYDINSKLIQLEKFSTFMETPLVARSESLVNWLAKRYELYKPIIVVMEGQFLSRFSGSSMAIVKLAYAVEYGILKMGGALYKNIAPSTLKAFVTGNGASSKLMVARALFYDYGHNIKDDDMADALGLCTVGIAIIDVLKKLKFKSYNINEPKSMLKFENDVIDIVDEMRPYKGKSLINIMYYIDHNRMCTLLEMLPQLKQSVKIRRKTDVYYSNRPFKLFSIFRDNEELFLNEVELMNNELLINDEPSALFYEEYLLNCNKLILSNKKLSMRNRS